MGSFDKTSVAQWTAKGCVTDVLIVHHFGNVAYYVPYFVMEVNRLGSVFQRRTSNGSVNKGDGLSFEVTKGTPTCSWLRSTENIFRPVQYCFLGDLSLEMINGSLKGIERHIYFVRIAEVNVFYY